MAQTECETIQLEAGRGCFSHTSLDSLRADGEIATGDCEEERGRDHRPPETADEGADDGDHPSNWDCYMRDLAIPGRLTRGFAIYDGDGNLKIQGNNFFSLLRYLDDGDLMITVGVTHRPPAWGPRNRSEDAKQTGNQ